MNIVHLSIFMVDLHNAVVFCFLSDIHFSPGDVDGAKVSLNICLDSDPTFSEAHLLMAQV